MSEQDKISFENWYISEHCKDLSEISINEVMAKTSLGVYSSFHVNGAYSGWQAATAESNKRIEALESEVANLRLNIKAQEQLGYELQANNNDLREAFNDLAAIVNRGSPSCQKGVVDKCKCTTCVIDRGSATPAESLQAHDAETIKRYADDLDNNHWVFIPHDLRKPLKEGK